jgi:hypothetical protein
LSIHIKETFAQSEAVYGRVPAESVSWIRQVFLEIIVQFHSIISGVGVRNRTSPLDAAM